MVSTLHAAYEPEEKHLLLKATAVFWGVQSQRSSPEISDVKAFSTATCSFDVWIIEDKFTGQFVFYIVHFSS